MSGEGCAMRTILPALGLILVASTPANAATRNFGVSGFDRIRVEGPFRVKVTTGVAPFARASGSAQGIDGLSIATLGRTLVVRGGSSWGGYPGAAAGPIEVEIGTHELSSASLVGSGSLAISAVKGLTFDLTAQGSGAASIGAVAVDQFRLQAGCSGAISLAGAAQKITAVIRGVSSFDARELAVKNAVIGAEGAATIRMNVSETAKVDARGASTVELTGSPACASKTQGSASVSGCR